MIASLKLKMKKIFFLSLLLHLSQRSLFAFEIRDDQGAVVIFTTPPQRIISLLPSLTETVCILGSCEKLVGIDRYSDWPTRVNKLPKLGGGLDPNIEAIVALKPDVVLTTRSARISERLKAVGIKVLVFNVDNYFGIEKTILQLAMLLGLKTAEGELVWQNILKQINLTANGLPVETKGLRVYYEVSNSPYGAGQTSFIGETLSRLQVSNIIPGTLGSFPKLNPEFIVNANPQVIMLADSSSKDIEKRPGWHKINAVINRRICVFTPPENNILSRPGPRIPEAANIMANCLKKMYPQ